MYNRYWTWPLRISQLRNPAMGHAKAIAEEPPRQVAQCTSDSGTS